MEIVLADQEKLSIVKRIAQETIVTVYPRYYPIGAVNFFKAHHCDANICSDLNSKCVYLLKENDTYVGTITIKGNEICRLFVLPEYQHKGYGQSLLDFAEKKILNDYDSIDLDASLPAKRLYQLRGYVEKEYHVIETENGDMLCYDVMSKIQLEG